MKLGQALGCALGPATRLLLGLEQARALEGLSRLPRQRADEIELDRGELPRPGEGESDPAHGAPPEGQWHREPRAAARPDRFAGQVRVEAITLVDRTEHDELVAPDRIGDREVGAERKAAEALHQVGLEADGTDQLELV